MLGRMLLLLLACATDKTSADADDSDVALDTVDTDAGDTDDTDPPPAPWVPPDLTCPLVNPRPVDVATPLGDLYGPDFLDLLILGSYAEDFEREWGCPTGTLDDGVERWSGDCETEEVSWAGRWTHVWGEGADGSTYESSEGEAAHYVDRSLTGCEVTFDGVSAYVQDEAGVETMDRTFGLDLRGYDYPERGGLWNVDMHERYVPGGPTTMDGYYDAVPDAGEPGDYCLFVESYAAAECDAEPWGGLVVVGDATLIVTWDPDVTCDGCGDATLDGVPVGRVCDTFLAWVSPA